MTRSISRLTRRISPSEGIASSIAHGSASKVPSSRQCGSAAHAAEPDRASGAARGDVAGLDAHAVGNGDLADAAPHMLGVENFGDAAPDPVAAPVELQRGDLLDRLTLALVPDLLWRSQISELPE